MGWSFSYGHTRKDVIAELTRDESRRDGGIFRTLAHCCKGTVLYAVHENEFTNKAGEIERHRFVAVHMLQNGGYDGWGYKSVSEEMGPYQTTCPPKYFEIAGPTDSKTAQEWRDKCLAAAADRKVKGSVKVGDTIVFKPGITIGRRSEKEKLEGQKAVVTKRKGRGIWVRMGHYDNVRIKVSHIDKVLPDGGGRRAAHEAQSGKVSDE